MMLERIPVASPRSSYLAHKDAIDAAVQRVLERGVYILGNETAAFEGEFAAYAGTSHAIGVASGTDAIELALRAAGIRQGDGVITTSNTAVATVAAIERSGAEVVFVDIDPRTYTLDCSHVERVIADDRTRRIRGIVPVHLYGHPAPMGEISRIASAHDLIVVEDCAQAHGASIDGRRVGSFGHAAAFSFYPTKNLGAMGDGGAVVTNDARIAGNVRAFRQYGWRQRYVSETRGWNSRLDELQAAVLRVKLTHLDRENGRRREIAATYHSAIASGDLFAPVEQPGASHVYHQYVVRTARRDALRAFLDERGIDTSVLYAVPVHLQPAYADEFRTSLPVTEQLANEILSLPVYPELPESSVNRVREALGEWR